ncbi:hypothetical protein H8S90_16325 [Olivibacter sp. SDN3]|uniref:hypothetical protein n=1 Tax=Olivibacter sp. SDN3 TaxID=2764720 RepID=UPI0016518A95|nr:hypothetical protein [Olivibacter sp. SDN3]QNL48354.1 hypothetical protein H8S90_16325 [Olivibacter sp. SDN3]
MDKTYYHHELHINVTFEKQIIRIKNDIYFWQFLNQNIEKRTRWLVQMIKTDYLDIFGTPLIIADQSFVLEIWGHVYIEYYMLKISHLLKLYNNKVLKRVSKSSQIIDCGEKEKDTNRRLWDILAPLEKIIAMLLPKYIAKSGLISRT